jgi:flavin reductase (DIM6/NTAB) family NADH-FMN oxidoreductase RutF
VRRLRGRLGGAVSLWTTGGAAGEGGPTGLTVTSLMLAPGEPARVLALLDPDADLVEALPDTGTAVVQLLRWEHRDLADAFAGVAPAPGGAFRMGVWQQTQWGPLLEGVTAWAGVRVAARHDGVGWSTLLDCVVEHVVLGADEGALAHRRGRYVRAGGR